MKEITTKKEYIWDPCDPLDTLKVSYFVNGKIIAALYHGEHYSILLKYLRREVFHHVRTEEEAIAIINKHISTCNIA